MQATAHQVVHHVVVGRHTAEDLLYHRGFLRLRHLGVAKVGTALAARAAPQRRRACADCTDGESSVIKASEEHFAVKA
eukprot:scaffold1102_cov256-Pinguiococcus_pyrenoidosus.AAC.53